MSRYCPKCGRKLAINEPYCFDCYNKINHKNLEDDNLNNSKESEYEPEWTAKDSKDRYLALKIIRIAVFSFFAIKIVAFIIKLINVLQGLPS